MTRPSLMRWLASGSFSLITAFAHAGGPVGVCHNVPTKYPGAGAVTLNYDRGALGSRTKEQADALITAAISVWPSVATTSVTLARGADLPVDVTTANYTTYYQNISDGLNPVIYDTDGSIIDLIFGAGAKNQVVGFAGSIYYDYITYCQYAEGVAVINGHIPGSDTSLQVVVAHEIGHLIGMDHAQLNANQGLSNSNFPLMYPIVNFRTSLSLHEDDAAAVSALYPGPSLNSVYGQLSGTFTQASGTPILGANIWAREINTHRVYSVVSDYLMQGTGYFRLLLPAGTYDLHAEAIAKTFTGGSSVGPYAENLSSSSFQPPLYDANGVVAMAPVTLGGATPSQFVIAAGCSASIVFKMNGTGSTGSSCVPAAPTGLSATAVSPSQINLAWTASTDNVGVTAYKVYRGGVLIATLGNVTSYSDTGLTASTAYTYTVQACDGAGNCSAQSAAASVTTPGLQVSGSCGSANGVPSTIAPSSGLCNSGTASAVTNDNPAQWAWICAGNAGGTNASCSAPRLVATFNVSNAAGLRAALVIAGTNVEDDVIVLAAGTYATGGATFTFATNENKTLTLQGANGTTRDQVVLGGGGASRVLDFGCVGNCGAITLRGLTVQNGNVTGEGGHGGGVMTSANLVISDVVFVGNRAAGEGGALYNVGPSTTVTNSSFSINTAGASGGAIRGFGTVTVTNSTFSNNTAANNGGAINGYGTVTSSTFSGNSATNGDGGGAIFGGGTLTNSTFSNNTAANNGGAIFGGGTITNSLFSNNSAGGNGGAIYASSSLIIANDTFSGNSAVGSGAAIHTVPTSSIINSVFYGHSTPVIYAQSAYNLYNNLIGTSTGIAGSTPIMVGNLAPGATSPFVDAANGNFRLVAGSLAIDAGLDPNSTTFANLVGSSVADIRQALLTDLQGSLRPAPGTAVDIGAYEFRSEYESPTVPTGLSATAISSSQINLAWTASTDNVGVIAYKVYRGGVLTATLGNVTSYSNTGLAASTTYSYTVQACDAVGNCSAQSAAATATTVPAFISQSDCLFNWAERNFPDWFAPAGATSNTLAQYYYRYYPQTNAYVATSSADNHVYYLGPLSGNSILDAGALSSWLSTAGCQ